MRSASAARAAPAPRRSFVSDLAQHWRWVGLIWLEVSVAYAAYSLYLAARARRAGRREEDR
jgi:hypothetical protein